MKKKRNALKGQAAFSKVDGSSESFFDKYNMGEKALRTTHASSILALTSCSPPVVCITQTAHSY